MGRFGRSDGPRVVGFDFPAEALPEAPAAGYPAPPAPYGAPDAGAYPPAEGYGAPAAPAYGSPADGYGAPAAPAYGSPADGYGAPPAPAYGGPADGYGAPPAPEYAAPEYAAPAYGAPAYGAPAAPEYPPAFVAAPAYAPPGYGVPPGGAAVPADPTVAAWAGAPGYPQAEPAGYGAPVATLPPPGHPQPGAYPAPAQWQQPAHKRRLTGKAAVVAVVLALLVAGFMVKEMWDTSAPPPAGSKRVERVTLKTPARIGTYPRMSNDVAKNAERTVTRMLPAQLQPRAGVYGKAGKPRYLMIAAFSAEPTSAAMLSAFTEGFATGGNEVGKARTMPGGVTCATVEHTAGVNGAVCAWAGQRSNGVLMSYDRADTLRSLAKLTTKARADVDGR